MFLRTLAPSALAGLGLRHFSFKFSLQVLLAQCPSAFRLCGLANGAVSLVSFCSTFSRILAQSAESSNVPVHYDSAGWHPQHSCLRHFSCKFSHKVFLGVNGPRHFTTKFSHKVLLAHVRVYFDCAGSGRVLVAILARGILLVTLGSSASQAMANCIPKVWHSTGSRRGSLRARCSVLCFLHLICLVFHSLAFLQHSMHPRQGSPVLSCLVFLARPKHSMHRWLQMVFIAASFFLAAAEVKAGVYAKVSRPIKPLRLSHIVYLFRSYCFSYWKHRIPTAPY